MAIPPAPTNVTATALSSSRIRIKWDDVPVEEDGYRVESRPCGSSAAWDPKEGLDAGTVSYTDMGLEPNTCMEYRVLAIDEPDGAGPPSAVVQATTFDGARIVGGRAIRRHPPVGR